MSGSSVHEKALLLVFRGGMLVQSLFVLNDGFDGFDGC